MVADHAVTFCVTSAPEVTRLCLVGSAPTLGRWDLERALLLSYSESAGKESSTVWTSPVLRISSAHFPLRFKLVANGHRHSPNTRPLMWDRSSRVVDAPPANGRIVCEFEPTADNSDNGWVHSAGVGAFQLRVGQPAGSAEPLVVLEHALEQPIHVDLYEATPNDPAVPTGKTFARLSCAEMGLLDSHLNLAPVSDENVTYLMNSQTIDALAFRVDVTAVSDNRLLARCFVSAETLIGLEGNISATLLSPDLQKAGTFRAAFLVVTQVKSGNNILTGLQRSRWVPNVPTLDIGHRGSGASKAKGHSVRENTLLSFQKAAANHSDVIEFDVHVTADKEVVVHHDFEVKLKLGSSTVKLPIPVLAYQQLQSHDFTSFMVQPSEHSQRSALDTEIARRRDKLQRTMTSGEDLLRTVFKPGMTDNLADNIVPEVELATRWFLADRIATLREAFNRTPAWLGFNIEIKYPTAVEVAAMRTQFYCRNTVVDEVLKVVLQEGRNRKVIFSTFDPDCATLLSLKQPRFPVFFLTCGGTKEFADPRMNSLEAALQFALSSHLQGVVAESRSVMGRLSDVVLEFHRHGLFLFTWGDSNNDYEIYKAQKAAGIDAIIMDDIARISKATKKERSLFNKPMRTPSNLSDLHHGGDGASNDDLNRLTSEYSGLNMFTLSPIGSPNSAADLALAATI